MQAGPYNTVKDFLLDCTRSYRCTSVLSPTEMQPFAAYCLCHRRWLLLFPTASSTFGSSETRAVPRTCTL